MKREMKMKKPPSYMIICIGLVANLALSCFIQVSKTTQISDKERVNLDIQSLDIPDGYARNLRWDLPLDSIGQNGSKISWTSSKPGFITSEGRLLKQSPPDATEKVKVEMTAEVASGKFKKEKAFVVHVAYQDLEYDGYLFAYFEGAAENRKSEEQLRFAASADALNWTALNQNKPVLDSDDISQSGGIRDPHILRGEDKNSFYIVATDMSTSANGWKENPGIVLLKSRDLLNWTHGTVNLAKDYPEKFANAYWVWAPQTIYDPGADKYLVYFTVKFRDDEHLDFYYAYANSDFNGFENEPQFMFRAKYGAIDGDIIYKDGMYHLFFKGNTKDENGKEFKSGIKQAVSPRLQGPWKEHFVFLDAYRDSSTSVEGSSIFKLNDSDTYILMYDLYSSGRYEFQRSKNLYEFSQQPETFNKNFHPRHGSVMGITREEAQRLNEQWGGVPKTLLD